MKERTSNLVYTAFTKRELLKNNIFRRVVPLWNTIPRKIIDNAQSHENMKRKLNNTSIGSSFMKLIGHNLVENVGVSIASKRKQTTILFLVGEF